MMIINLFPKNVHSEVWDQSCKIAINDLKTSQQKVSEAYEQLNAAETNVESSKFSYHSCKSSDTIDCETEDSLLGITMTEYNISLIQLNEVLSEFKDDVEKVNELCLE
jgi:hypothetical protein